MIIIIIIIIMIIIIIIMIIIIMTVIIVIPIHKIGQLSLDTLSTGCNITDRLKTTSSLSALVTFCIGLNS